MPNDAFAIAHDAVAQRFTLDAQGQEVVADYRALPDGTWVFTHTLVPPALRGRGLAGTLVKSALDAARAGGHRVVPQCSYVARYIAGHHEYADLLAT